MALETRYLPYFNNEFKSFIEYDKWAMFVQGQTWQKFKSVLGLIVQNLELKQINDDLINLFKNNINIDIDADESNVNKENYTKGKVFKLLNFSVLQINIKHNSFC